MAVAVTKVPPNFNPIVEPLWLSKSILPDVSIDKRSVPAVINANGWLLVVPKSTPTLFICNAVIISVAKSLVHVW